MRRVHLARHSTFGAIRTYCGELVPDGVDPFFWEFRYWRKLRGDQRWDSMSTNQVFCNRCIAKAGTDDTARRRWWQTPPDLDPSPSGEDLLRVLGQPANIIWEPPADRIVGEFDNRGRLHCGDGPAWSWRNGPSVYALNGIVVPQWCVDTYDPHDVTLLPESERRRAVWANYGWDRVVTDLGWRVIDRHGDPYLGTLYRVPDRLLVDRAGDPLNLLVARNASPHPGGEYEMFGLPVPTWCYSTDEAQASLWGIRVHTYVDIESRS